MAHQVLAGSNLFYFCRIDTSGKYIEVNQCFLNKFKHITDDFRGFPVKQTIHPEDIPLLRQIFRACLENPGTTYRGHIRKPQADGTYAYSDWEFCFNHETQSVSAIGYDLTAREEQLQTIMKSTADIILVLDKEGTYLEAFAMDEELLAAPVEDLINSRIEDHFDAEETAIFLGLIERVYQEGEIQNINYDIEVTGGKKHYVANARLFPYNGKKCVAWSARDFTQIKLYQEQLDDQNKRLKNIAFYQSHKVRGPLSNILGITTLLKTIEPKDIDPVMIDYLVEAAEDLDKVLHQVVDETEEIEFKKVLNTK